VRRHGGQAQSGAQADAMGGHFVHAVPSGRLESKAESYSVDWLG
jgi:hypothetical protein